jgi:hypothetical protein
MNKLDEGLIQCFEFKDREIIKQIINDWLTQKGNQYDQKYDETNNEHYVGAKYAIRELLEDTQKEA